MWSLLRVAPRSAWNVPRRVAKDFVPIDRVIRTEVLVLPPGVTLRRESRNNAIECIRSDVYSGRPISLPSRSS